MKVLIICEGYDDAYLVADYINKTNNNKWKYTKERFKGFSISEESQDLTRYINTNDGTNTFLTYSVGGKSNFKNSIDKVISACEKSNEDTPLFDDIVVLMDKDNDTIDEKIEEINNYFLKWNSALEDRERCNVTYITDFKDKFTIKITPIIVPLDGSGAIETSLRQSIASIDDEHKFIVDESEMFIANISVGGSLKQHLQKEREIEKAKFSAAISVISPERSIGEFKKLFDASDWTNTPNIKKQFGVLAEIFKS